MTTPTEESPEAGRAERAGLALGVGLGRCYFATVAAVATPIRRCPTPTWHWRAGYRCGVRLRCAPHRLRTGLRRLLRTRKLRPPSLKAGAARLGVATGVGWWGLEWAARAEVPVWPLAAGGAALLLAVAYAAGSDPETKTRPAPRRHGRRGRRGRRGDHQERAATRLLWAIGQLLEERSALHITELADQINTRNRAAGRRVLTAARLRALLEELGAPVRDQMTIGSRTGPGLDAEDWREWRGGTRRRAGVEETAPALPRAETAPTETETPQVRRDDQDISAQDLAENLGASDEDGRLLDTEALMLIRHARTAIGSDRGAHLRTILATAQAAGDCTGWSVTRLRRALEAADIRVEEKLWIRGGNTRGVLAESLPSDTERAA
ncbi:hypothetical protein [Streptomyces sulphureus]|uniref:hypothetical protein n=1 Tax=Streptomyces sulphureus TaxID=47758 RepID=UPI00036A64A8|nr:hypothetical protein [Streptomyces sulphureus]